MDTLFRKFNIDGELTGRILRLVQAQDRQTGDATGGERFTFPTIDGVQVIDGTSEEPFVIDAKQASQAISAIDPVIDLSQFALKEEGSWSFTPVGLEELGLRLLPYLAFGFLNGGSATSYIDSKKNSSFYPPLSELINAPFSKLAGLCDGRAKGLTPAYINEDGTPGSSFLELKLRALLIMELKASQGSGSSPSIAAFQMTSGFTHEQTIESFREYRDSPLLKDLIEATGHDITEVLTARQSLLAAFTPAEEGFPRRIFTQAYGKQDTLLPLPGGHGQNFYVLRDIYRQLHAEGKRFAYLVNIDNLGNTPSPAYLAMTALSGCNGSFEFSFKSPVDIKGGVLVRDGQDRCSCRDIGVAIPAEAVAEAEGDGKPILFNCATGLFNLSYLTSHLDEIIDKLPLRVSEQNKDAGRYSQAEQVTWEIIDLMEKPVIIAVNKQERFLAAKLLSESIMTANAHLYTDELLKADASYRDFCDVSLSLEKGFIELMEHTYGMRRQHGRWVPLPLEEL